MPVCCGKPVHDLLLRTSACADADLKPLSTDAIYLPPCAQEQQLEHVLVLVLCVAGRWDLHNAITQHGGYAAVAAELERRQCNALPDDLLTPKVGACDGTVPCIWHGHEARP